MNRTKGRPRRRRGLSGTAVRRIEALVIEAGNDWKRPVRRQWVDLEDLAEAGTR